MTGCVYLISNTVTGAGYVGSSVRGEHFRWKRHRRDLLNGTHHSRHLQRAWNKYGESAFVLLRLESESSPSMLLELEQAHLDFRLFNFPRSMTYNVLTNVAAPYGRKISEETRQKMRRSHLGRKQTREQHAKQQLAWNSKFEERVLIGPDGKEYRLRAVNPFAKKHKVSPQGIRGVLAGKSKQHRGWSRPDSPAYSLLSPAGDFYPRIIQLKKFCIEHELNFGVIHGVATGTKRSWHGWTCPSPVPPYRGRS